MKLRAIPCILLIFFVSLACSMPGFALNNDKTTATMVTATQTALSVQISPEVAATSIPDNTPEVSSSLVICQDETCMEDGLSLSYLVVTRPLFINALTPFINWKSEQGYRVGLVTVDWLSQHFPARHLAESMKTGMHTLRQQTGVQYVLLLTFIEVC